ncbi:MAG: Fe-S cluster assembly protein SufD [Acidobacteriota bacterium]|nr:Fe-S cluster assembly protein SufD [Acidobacteriota bacterium]
MDLQAAKETIYAAEFRRALQHSNQPIWLKMLRENAFEYFTENGFPTVKNEAWKYTNVAPISQEDFSFDAGIIDAENLKKFTYAESNGSQLVCVDGKLNRESSVLPQDLTLLSFDEAFQNEKFAQIIKEKLAKAIAYDSNGFTALNTAFLENGTFLYLPKEAKIDAPVHLLYVSTENKASFPRVLIVAESFAEATIIESYTRAAETKYLTNAVVEIFLADEAKLKHFRVQRESHEAFHTGATAAEINRGSVYDSTNINLGGKLSRHDIRVRFNAEAGEAFVDGLYMLNENQHHDTHSIIDHALPNCNSHQNYKGVLNDKSRGVFNGIVFVRENASGTDAKQSNKNLLLSNDARIDTKPQLEIFNDDVKCAHGATVGQLEEEELFYLLSRGLSENMARNLLTYGFAEEIINKIEIESIKKELDEAVLNRLNVNLGT